MRPLAWSDSFGFRHVVTRSRDITETGQLAGLKIRTIQTPIYVKAVELMGASPTPMAFGEVYTSLQTGVIDGYEHDANTTMQQRFYEIAGFMARTGHIAGVLGLLPPRRPWLACLPTCAPRSKARRSKPRDGIARAGRRGCGRNPAARHERHDDPRDRSRRAAAGRRAALGDRSARARHLVVARGRPRVSAPGRDARPASRADLALQWALAVLVVAQAAVVGLQVVGRHVLHQPIPWTEEIARLLLAWLMCVGGIIALRHGQHPRVTALVRLLAEPRARGCDRGLRLVLLALFLSLVVPAWQLTVASAAERLPASDISGAWISAILPSALLLMSAVVVQQLYDDGLASWRDRRR